MANGLFLRDVESQSTPFVRVEEEPPFAWESPAITLWDMDNNEVFAPVPGVSYTLRVEVSNDAEEVPDATVRAYWGSGPVMYETTAEEIDPHPPKTVTVPAGSEGSATTTFVDFAFTPNGEADDLFCLLANVRAPNDDLTGHEYDPLHPLVTQRNAYLDEISTDMADDPALLFPIAAPSPLLGRLDVRPPAGLRGRVTTLTWQPIPPLRPGGLVRRMMAHLQKKHGREFHLAERAPFEGAGLFVLEGAARPDSRGRPSPEQQGDPGPCPPTRARLALLRDPLPTVAGRRLDLERPLSDLRVRLRPEEQLQGVLYLPRGQALRRGEVAGVRIFQYNARQRLVSGFTLLIAAVR
jgi:hypothetical protein